MAHQLALFQTKRARVFMRREPHEFDFQAETQINNLRYSVAR